MIIAYLMLGNKSFMELKQKLEDISQNILIEKLEELIDCGLIYKKDLEEDCYCLTKFGESLRTIIDSMNEWGKSNR